MKLTFTKGPKKFDELVIERDDGSRECLQCPKQGIIPHDMVHYAVEKVMYQAGFLSRVAAGEQAGFAMAQQAASEAIERLVETMQAELWSGQVDAAEIIAMYHTACDARSHAAIAVTPEDIRLIRHEIETATVAWQATPVHGQLVLSIAGPAS